MPPRFQVGTPTPELTLEQAIRKARAERDAFDARRSQAARGHPMGSLGEARVSQHITPLYGSLQAPKSYAQVCASGDATAISPYELFGWVLDQGRSFDASRYIHLFIK